MYGMDRDRRRQRDRLHSPYRGRDEIYSGWDADPENSYGWLTGPVGASDDDMYPEYGGYKSKRDGYRSSSRMSYKSYQDGGSRRRDTSRMSYHQPERDEFGQGSYDKSYRLQRDFHRYPSYDRSRPRDERWESRRTSREDLFDDDGDRRGRFSGPSDRGYDDKEFRKHDRGRSRGNFEDSEWDGTDDEWGKGKDKKDKGGYGDYGDYGGKKEKGGYGDYGDKKEKGGYGDYGDKKEKGGYGDYGDKKDKDKGEKGDKDKKKSKVDFDQLPGDDENYIRISGPKGKGRGIHLQAHDNGFDIEFHGKKSDDKSKSKSSSSKKDSGYKDTDNESLGPDDPASCIPNFGDYGKKKDGNKSWDHLRPSSNDRIEMSGGRGNGQFKSRQISPGAIEMQRVSQRRSPRDSRKNQWTEIDKNLVVKDALEAMNYEYEERSDTYYIFSFLDSNDISALLELSDEIQDERCRRIRQIEREKRRERARIDRVVMERSQSWSPPYHYSSYDRDPYRAPRMGMPYDYTSRKYRGSLNEGWIYEDNRW